MSTKNKAILKSENGDTPAPAAPTVRVRSLVSLHEYPAGHIFTMTPDEVEAHRCQVQVLPDAE
jgi:hypothetical protein